MRPALHARARAVKKFLSAYTFRKSQFAPRLYSLGGAGAAANTTQWVNGSATVGGYVTSQVCMTAEAPFIGVQLIFGNRDAVAYPISGASVASGPTLSDPTNSTSATRQNFVAVTFGGLASGTVAAAAGGNTSYLVSDLISVASMARLSSDSPTWTKAGGKLGDCAVQPILHIRVAQPTAAASSSLLGMSVGGNAQGTSTAPLAAGNGVTATGKFVSCQNSAAAGMQLSVGAAAAMVGTNYGPFCATIDMPIVGVIFQYASNAMSVVWVGDSISAGAGLTSATDYARPFPKTGTELASTVANPIEYSLMAIAGTPSSTFEGWFENLINAGIVPTHAVFPTTSPNDGPAGPGSAQVALTNQWLAKCAASNIYPLCWTAMPVGLLAPQKYTSAGETARLNWNIGIRAGGSQFSSAKPIDFMEFDQYAIGAQAVSDNVSPIASFTTTPVAFGDSTYNLHPSTPCNSGLATGVVVPKLQAIAAKYYA